MEEERENKEIKNGSWRNKMRRRKRKRKRKKKRKKKRRRKRRCMQGPARSSHEPVLYFNKP